MEAKAPWIGYFSPDGSPILQIAIRSATLELKDFEAVIDTGFTGFLSVPVKEANRLGLVPTTMQNVVFADNSEHARWIASGTVVIGTESRTGSIFLEPFANEVLVGMEFIHEFERSLFLFIADNIVQFLTPEASKKLAPILAQH